MMQNVATTVFSEFLGRQLDINSETPLESINGWDSLKFVRLIVYIEEKIGRELTESEMESIRSVGDVEGLLANAG